MFGLTSKKGFTLIELLIAITIIGILSATLIPRIANVIPTARDAARKASINDVVASVEAFNIDKGSYPNTFCLLEPDGTDTTIFSTTYKRSNFITDYLRGSVPTFAKIDGNTDCLDNATAANATEHSAKYTKDGTGYIVGIGVELAKSANSGAIDDPDAAIGANGPYYYVVAR